MTDRALLDALSGQQYLVLRPTEDVARVYDEHREALYFGRSVGIDENS